jgi:hypothetical protein
MYTLISKMRIEDKKYVQRREQARFKKTPSSLVCFSWRELELEHKAAPEPHKHCEYHGFPYVHVDPLTQLVDPE